MIPRLKPAIGLGEALAVCRSGGIEAFEAAFAARAGQKHAIAFPYGRTGLLYLFKAMGWRNRKILCPAYTCVVVAHAIEKSGNIPVFVDSVPCGFNMNLELAAKAVDEDTVAIIATSLFGEPVNLDRLDRFRAAHPGVQIIQDCAHSFFAEWNGHPVQREGIAAVYGLNISKIMTSIFGGMVTTDDDALASRLREVWRQDRRPSGAGRAVRRALYLAVSTAALSRPVYSIVNGLERTGVLDRFTRYYDEAVIDLPNDHLCVMTGVEARVGRVQIDRIDELIAHRRLIAGIYKDRMTGDERFVLPDVRDGHTVSHFAVLSDRADVIEQTALSHGVQLGRLVDYIIPDMPSYKERVFFDAGVSRAYVPRVLNLPVHSGISAADAVRIADIVTATAGEKR